MPGGAWCRPACGCATGLRDGGLRNVACPPAEIPKAEPDDPLPGLLSTMGGCADGRALVFEQGHLVGIVSPGDISRTVLLHAAAVTATGPRRQGLWHSWSSR